MKKLLVILAVSCLICAFAGPVMAEEEEKQAPYMTMEVDLLHIADNPAPVQVEEGVLYGVVVKTEPYRVEFRAYKTIEEALESTWLNDAVFPMIYKLLSVPIREVVVQEIYEKAPYTTENKWIVVE